MHDGRQQRVLGTTPTPEHTPGLTVSDFQAEWWALYAVPTLSPKTRHLYAYLWRAQVAHSLGGLQLGDVSPLIIERWKSDRLSAGVGPETVRRILAMIQSMFARAVDWGYLTTNPVARVQRPRASHRRLVRPLAPSVVERIRASIGTGTTDALLVSVLAYAGLRPGEALALTWGAVGDRHLLIEQAVSMGALTQTKTGRARTVRLLDPLAADLLKHRNQLPERADDDLVFPGKWGAPWTETQWRNWRRRVFAPAAAHAGAAGARPYDLRHSFVSLLIAEGRSVIDVARQAGHNPTMTLQTYGHVFDEFDGRDRTSTEERIAAARFDAARGSGGAA